MVNELLDAHPTDHMPENIVIACMQRDGPPFIFAAPTAQPVGTRFELGGFVFSIMRVATRAEYRANQKRVGGPDIGLSTDFYFEAVTD